MSGALSEGRHAQIIPVSASMVVQIVELRVPHVGSADFELFSRVVMRRTEVTQTLFQMST